MKLASVATLVALGCGAATDRESAPIAPSTAIVVAPSVLPTPLLHSPRPFGFRRSIVQAGLRELPVRIRSILADPDIVICFDCLQARFYGADNKGSEKYQTLKIARDVLPDFQELEATVR